MKLKTLSVAGVLCGLSLGAVAGNMAYVEVNSNRLENARCYVDAQTKKPFFAMVSIFAANINGSNPNAPELYLNDQVTTTLQSKQIEALQQSGIKVLLTIMGNHQNAGWSCMTDPDAAKIFAARVVNLVNQYHLDGVDIDDEYSRCATNATSQVMMAQAIKNHPKFKDKLLTKALYNDVFYFYNAYQGHKLNEYLDYGFEMSYFSADFWTRIGAYFPVGMTIPKLMIGASTDLTYPDAFGIGKFTERNKTAGVMVYDLRKDSLGYLDLLGRGLTDNKSGVEVVEGCLL